VVYAADRVRRFSDSFRRGVLGSPHATSCIDGGVSPERPGYDNDFVGEDNCSEEGEYERHYHRRRGEGQFVQLREALSMTPVHVRFGA
jgi:hypothetical protein